MAEKILIRNFTTPVGELILGAFQGELCLADWRYRKMREKIDTRIKAELKADFIEGSDPVLEKATRQLDEYFEGSRQSFDLPLRLCGSAFQKKVWMQLLEIPFGQTESYLDLSRKTGDEKAIRAVASANGANAISIIVPCHRVVGSDGSLTGYAGGLNAKLKLLQLEGAQLPSAQPTLF